MESLEVLLGRNFAAKDLWYEDHDIMIHEVVAVYRYDSTTLAISQDFHAVTQQATGMGRGNRFPIALPPSVLTPRVRPILLLLQRLPIPDKVPG